VEFPIPRITYKDILEIIFIAFFIYQLLLLIKGTRAIQILQGLGVLLVSLWICNLFSLRTLYWILNNVIVVIFVAIPIVFQPELRRALGQIGKGGILSLFSSGEEEFICMIDEIVDACFHMSRKKVGAIIVIERDIGLEEFMETGTPLNSKITSRLIQTIFFHNSPLHDGAIIIKENKIHSAACYLPLTESIDIDKDLGTRHRAALGITEHTDCIAIVVSEETGSVSLCTNGRLKYNMTMKALDHHLRALCNPRKRVERRFLFFPVIKKLETCNLKELKTRVSKVTKYKLSQAEQTRQTDVFREELDTVTEKSEDSNVLHNKPDDDYKDFLEKEGCENISSHNFQEISEKFIEKEKNNSNGEYGKIPDDSGAVINIKESI